MVVLGLIVLGVTAVLIWMVYGVSYVPDDRKKIARLNGFSFVKKEKDLPVIQRLNETSADPLFLNYPDIPAPQVKYAANIMSGRRDDLNVWIFDWIYTDRLDSTRTLIEDLITVAVLEPSDEKSAPFAFYRQEVKVPDENIGTFLEEAIAEYRKVDS